MLAAKLIFSCNSSFGTIIREKAFCEAIQPFLRIKYFVFLFFFHLSDLLVWLFYYDINNTNFLFTSGVISRILPSTLWFSLHAKFSSSSTLGWWGTRPRAGERDLPISDIGECDRDGEIRLTGIRPSSVSCFTTLVLKIFCNQPKYPKVID